MTLKEEFLSALIRSDLFEKSMYELLLDLNVLFLLDIQDQFLHFQQRTWSLFCLKSLSRKSNVLNLNKIETEQKRIPTNFQVDANVIYIYNI